METRAVATSTASAAAPGAQDTRLTQKASPVERGSWLRQEGESLPRALSVERPIQFARPLVFRGGCQARFRAKLQAFLDSAQPLPVACSVHSAVRNSAGSGDPIVRRSPIQATLRRGFHSPDFCVFLRLEEAIANGEPVRALFAGARNG
jgi:hypothetical protein